MIDYSIQTMLDTAKNFGKVTLSTGYTNVDTVIVLVPGDGVRLPDPSVDGPFNLTWWNITDYLDPADDPNREIVRVITRVEDVLTVTRGQEGIPSSNKNIPNKTYKMILAVTAKLIIDIQSDAQTRVNNHAAITTSVHNFDTSGNAPPTLHGGEAHKGNVVTKTGNYTASINDDTILCNASVSSFSVLLPSASIRLGKIYNIKKIDSSSNGIIIDPSGTETIEGNAILSIQNQWDYYVLQSDGVNWIVLSSPVVVSMGQLNESVVNYNSPPYSGLTDILVMNENFVSNNESPQSGLTDTLSRSEFISITN